MKKQLLTVILTGLIITGQVVAQEIDSVVTMPTLNITSPAVVTREVNKTFEKSFPHATNLVWYKENKNYLAKFIQNDMRHRALFTKEGRLKYDLSFGNKNNLPENIKTMVSSAYQDHEITHVVNVKQEGRNIWVVNLENLYHLVLVRVEDEEMEEVGKYNKGR